MLLSKFLSRELTWKFVRQYSAPSGRCGETKVTFNPYVVDEEAAEKGYKFFKFVSYGICLPLTALYSFYLWRTYEHPQPIPIVPYDHFYAQFTKSWYWGDGKRGLFFNPKFNATVDDFEAALKEREKAEPEQSEM